jgi:hypothetical protein
MPRLSAETGAILPPGQPLLDRSVPAGFPSPAADYFEMRLSLDEHLVSHREATFFVRVSGNSMTGFGIHDGDLLVVDRALDPADRSIVVAVVDGDGNVLATDETVVVADATHCPLAEWAAWHIDPNRRPQGRRTTRLERHEPDLPAIERMRLANPHAAIKLAPACQPPDAWRHEAEWEWISRDRQCRQLVAWFGRLAEHPGRRRATVLECRAPGASFRRSVVGDAAVQALVAARLGRYVFDPDPAVVAAGLVGVIAAQNTLSAIDAHAAYLTGDHPADDAALACFEVTDVLPFDLKRLKSVLRARGIGRLEIKKRGVTEDPESLRRRLGLRGDRAAVLVLARIGRSVTAIIARRTGLEAGP